MRAGRSSTELPFVMGFAPALAKDLSLSFDLSPRKGNFDLTLYSCCLSERVLERRRPGRVSCKGRSASTVTDLCTREFCGRVNLETPVHSAIATRLHHEW